MNNLAKFLLELGMLKRVRRSGWWAAGVDNPESVAEHSWRAAVIGYFLAKEEHADADKVVKMLLFHDVAECRIDDIHKLAARYLDKEAAGKKVVEDQSLMLPKDVAAEYIMLMKEMEGKQTKESIVAKDADWLECAIQAKEYVDIGYKNCSGWIGSVRKALRTESAKRMLKEVLKEGNWWEGPKKL